MSSKENPGNSEKNVAGKNATWVAMLLVALVFLVISWLLDITGWIDEYLKLWRPPDIAHGGHRYCPSGPVVVSAGASRSVTPTDDGDYRFSVACSRMF